ncbi:MAG: hypothetical protein GX072_01405, partial [Lysinibacillus sp.]|nr:hypothetical protein [Lysinibacillus sp.]
MTQLLLTTLIFSIVTTILVVPISKKLPKEEQLSTKQLFQSLIFVLIASFIVYTAFIYLTKIDLHWTIFIYVLPIILLVGALSTSGAEQKIKNFLFFISLIGIVYMFAAPLFNANEKYESAKMEEKIEIEPFDESKTPASVPPHFAENKMKKAFGQVPNTSYYELGNLQIQKVNGEFV